MAAEYDRFRKIVLLGAPAAGKSTLLKRAQIKNDEEDPGNWATRPRDVTIGIDFSFRTVDRVMFQIFDTAGAERFRNIVMNHFYGPIIVTCVCDASELRSFDELRTIFDDFMFRRVAPESVVLLVNKIEVAVEGADEAAAALETHMQHQINKISGALGRQVPFERVEVAVSDPPSTVLRKFGMHCVSRRPGSVRLPAPEQASSVARTAGRLQKPL